MATYALLPRPKAIWSAPLSHQSVTGCSPAALRKPTMEEISRQACWHFQPSVEQVITWPPLGGPWSWPENSYPECTSGLP
jgi:hypothetical protein